MRRGSSETGLIHRAARAFHAEHGDAPAGIAFAPGRVNLIGEHIDYRGGPVLPAALERGIAVAFAPRDDRSVRARSVGPGSSEEAHPEVVFALDEDVRRDPAGGWGNYLRAAGLAAREEGPCRGAELVVAADVPEASGLSSSSALVVATGLAFMALAGRGGALTGERRRELAERFAEAERFTGTRGGGMDQAASLGGRAGHALRITFDPLRWTEVPLPDAAVFVVAHTGVRAEKSGAARAAYNRIRAGADDPLIAEHTRSEKVRVDDFVAGLEALGGAADPAERHRKLAVIGALMNASHASLRDRLGVSHPALERLVEAACTAGAAGARLTGAGFGGSVVALCSVDRRVRVVKALREAQVALATDPTPAFVVRAGSGARVEVPPPA
jgi:galactokinase